MLISDFDGVIVDGMEEYWWSACRAAGQFIPAVADLPVEVPEAFRCLRPQVHHGWEMPLLAAAVAGHGEPLKADFDRHLPNGIVGSLCSSLFGEHSDQSIDRNHT